MTSFLFLCFLLGIGALLLTLYGPAAGRNPSKCPWGDIHCGHPCDEDPPCLYR